MHFISYSRTESLSHLRQKLGTPVWNYFYKETVQFENMVYEQFGSEHGTQVQQKWVDFDGCNRPDGGLMRLLLLEKK